jgi:hypothetical protein
VLLWWAILLGVVPFAGDYMFYRRGRADREMRAALAKDQGKPFDARTPLARFVDLRKEDPSAVPIVTPASLREEPIDIGGRKTVPLAGISLAHTLDCNESGEYLVYDSDEHGFENPRGLYEKGLDILILGGSLTAGACVPPDQNIGAHVRKKIPKTLSLAYSDDGPLTELATLVEFGPMLAPKRVVWFHDWTDLNDLAYEENGPLVKYLEPDWSVGVATRQGEIDTALRAIVARRLTAALARGDLVPEPNVAKDVLMLRHIRGAFRSSQGARRIPLMRRVLERAKSVVAQWGGTLYVAWASGWESFLPGAKEQADRAPFFALVKELGLPLIDLEPAIRAHPDPLSLYPFRIRGHNTGEGYALMADAILRAIDH